MYSIVLMMALTGGADTPAWGRGCDGCNGNGWCGGSRAACNGWRSSCDGCHGRRWRDDCDCSGRKGWGWRRGCDGCSGRDSCHGRKRCHGCHGHDACHGATVVSCGGCTAPAAAPAAEPMPPAKQPEKVKKPAEEKETMAPASATIIVSLPAEAKLSVDGVVTTSASVQRVFVSPALERGKDYSYTLKADFVSGGKTVSVSKKVTVRAGEETRVSFEAPATVAMN